MTEEIRAQLQATLNLLEEIAVAAGVELVAVVGVRVDGQIQCGCTGPADHALAVQMASTLLVARRELAAKEAH